MAKSNLPSKKPGRKSVSKRIRFEVFKRDGFKCQYCGRSAPEIMLQVDHIHPVSKAGKSDLLNLITSCSDCNLGKSNRELTDDSTLTKQIKQLQELNDRREQLEMMLKWREGLNTLGSDTVKAASDNWVKLTRGQSEPNESGIAKLSQLIRKHGLIDVLKAMDDAGEIFPTSGKITEKEIDDTWVRFEKICAINHQAKGNPDIRKLFYIRGIVRNRFCYCNEGVAIGLLREALAAGADVEQLQQIALTAPNWTEWREQMEMRG